MTNFWWAAFVVSALALGTPASAVEPHERLPDPVLEKRARDLSAGLRCLVCQNESIDDSNADLARDLRRIVREQLTKGASDTQVKEYLVARYGDFVLLRPPFKRETLLLWLTPLLLLAGGVALARRATGNATEAASPPQLSQAEELELSKLLRENSGSRQN